MSIPVPLDGLRAALDERGGNGYLLSVSDDHRPHAVHASLRWEGDVLAIEVGKRSAANASARPCVSILCPARAESDYSLIVDGTAVVEERNGTPWVLLSPTKAVLHRPAPAPDPNASCKDDCVPLLRPADRPLK